MLNNVTPVILTFNEEANLRRTLKPLYWAKEVLIIDSGSTDQTLQICDEFGNVTVVQNAFENFAQQCNFALDQNIKTEWVLSMDADYIVTPELTKELSELNNDSTRAVAGYRINFDYLVDGRPLRCSLYPPRTCLYRKNSARYEQDGHAHRVVVSGEVRQLNGRIQHDDRKPDARWLNSQKNYARQEAVKLKQLNWNDLSWPDRVRRMGGGPLLIFPYTLLIRALILDGAPGWKYAKQRLVAECYLFRALFLKESRVVI